MIKKPTGTQYTAEETQRRFEAALRGYRNFGPKPMKSMTPKRSKAQQQKHLRITLLRAFLSHRRKRPARYLKFGLVRLAAYETLDRAIVQQVKRPKIQTETLPLY